MAGTLMSDNESPSLLFEEQGSDPSTPASGFWRAYMKSDGMYVIDDAGGVTGPFTDSAGGGVDSGTSNPVSPSAGDLYFRTDLGLLIYYDGTRWLTVEEYAGFSVGDALVGTSAAAPTLGWLPVPSGYDIYVTTVLFETYVATTNNGTKYWNFTLNKHDAANSTTSMGTADTSADSASTWTSHDMTINAVVTTSGFRGVRMNTSKTSTPGALYWALTFCYRLVVT